MPLPALKRAVGAFSGAGSGIVAERSRNARGPGYGLFVRLRLDGRSPRPSIPSEILEVGRREFGVTDGMCWDRAMPESPIATAVAPRTPSRYTKLVNFLSPQTQPKFFNDFYARARARESSQKIVAPGCGRHWQCIAYRSPRS